jgi:hypothetical protein
MKEEHMASRSQPVLAQSGQGEDESSGGWRGIETVDKGHFAESVNDPAWREPPDVLLLFAGGQIRVGHWDWYYSEVGDGDHVSKGHGWVEPTSGELLAMHYDPPTHWMPLPPPPHPHEEPESGSE